MVRASAVAFVICGAVLCSMAGASLPAGFMRGVSGTGSDAEAQGWLTSLGATHCRRYIFWSTVEPQVSAINESLSVSDLRADPAGLVYAWARTVDWSYADQLVQSLVDVNVTAVIELSEGTKFGLPRFNGTIADPGIIGIPQYLAAQYRFARAAANRYKSRVRLYQIENELNEAGLSTIYGQRLMTAPWSNWTFLTTLLQTLRMAVKDEDASLMVTMNFHTDVPKVVHDVLHIPGFYLDAVRQWAPLLDHVAIDAYPNMYVSSPSLGALVGERVAAVASLLQPTQMVFVMETGYPVNADGGTTGVPDVFNFSVAMQAQYLADAVKSVANVSQASGFFVFDVVKAPGMLPPAGGYTVEDVEMFAAIKAFLTTNDAWALISWLMKPGSIAEVLNRAATFMGRPDGEGGWGLIDAATNKPRASFNRLAKCYAGNGNC